MQVDELLIEFADVRVDIGDVVRDGLHGAGEVVKAGAGVGLSILHRLLHRPHESAKAVGGIEGLLKHGFHDALILVHGILHAALPLQEQTHVVLNIDDFLGDGFDRLRADERTKESAGQHGCAAPEQISITHRTPP